MSQVEQKKTSEALDPAIKKTEKIEKEIIKTETNDKIDKVIEVVLSSNDKYNYLSSNLINALEMFVFEYNDKSITFNVNLYNNHSELKTIFNEKKKPGKIFIGPISSEETRIAKKYCEENILIFSFASERSLAGECLYLFNFFIEDDLRTIFSYLDAESKIALIYPDNNYGNYVNDIIDSFAMGSKSTLIYKLKYNEDLSDARTIIKQLGKYEFRKQELQKQKKLLMKKNDEVSFAALKKLEKFETIGDLDFTHLIISDGNIRILELAPLLPFYDIDPNNIQFIGTGLWDEKSFFDEPSLQGAIFPGIEISERNDFVNSFSEIYSLPPPRTATIMYDLAALISILSKKHDNLNQIVSFLKEDNYFKGLDGNFSIKNNIIERELLILKITNGKAIEID